MIRPPDRSPPMADRGAVLLADRQAGCSVTPATSWHVRAGCRRSRHVGDPVAGDGDRAASVLPADARSARMAIPCRSVSVMSLPAIERAIVFEAEIAGRAR
ncbi:MAG: hypothetical protein U1E53_04760 [Dongiaceae bacterium]